ncbi:MAG TPA: hypothetical protein VNO21_27105, partial [Polyangiaceae bacterium]|nr:hypothetical protein [Polyangiaceae bacterium]
MMFNFEFYRYRPGELSTDAVEVLERELVEALEGSAAFGECIDVRGEVADAAPIFVLGERGDRELVHAGRLG